MNEEFDLIVIGSGPGGYVAAIRAAQLGLKTACIEKDPNLGGTCLNVGCIPSKVLLHASQLYMMMNHPAKDFGIECQNLTINFDAMQKKKQQIVSGFNTGIQGLFKKNQVTRIEGLARFISNNAIDVKGKTYRAKNYLIATGSEPMPLPFLPFDEQKILSSTGALSLNAIPKKMVVIGAGIIGVELGSVYRRLGSEVIFVEFLDRICPTLDLAISKAFQQILQKQGLIFHLSSKVTKGSITKEGISITYTGKEEQTLICNAALVSIGRRPFTQGLDLDKAGVKKDEKGFIPIDRAFRTNVPNIFAIGDVTGGAMLAHKASEEGIAAVEIIAGLKPHVEYIAIPSVVYTHPEVAAVGFTEEQCKSLGLSYKVGQFPFKANSRARSILDDEGFVKILAEEKSGKILGMHIIGLQAGELIHEGALALEKRLTVSDLATLCNAHPTLSEAIKEAALAIAKNAIHI